MEPVVRNEKQLGAALRRFRKATSRTQSDLAGDTGKRQATISTLEGGAGTLETLFSVLSVLELEIIVRPRKRSKFPALGDLF